jgi:hypothetical protein
MLVDEPKAQSTQRPQAATPMAKPSPPATLHANRIAKAQKAVRDTIPEGRSEPQYLLASSTVHLKRVLSSGVFGTLASDVVPVVTASLASSTEDVVCSLRALRRSLNANKPTQKCRKGKSSTSYMWRRREKK